MKQKLSGFDELKQLYKEKKIDEIVNIIKNNETEINNDFLNDAIYEDCFEIFKLLLPFCDIYKYNEGDLILASEMGRIEYIKLLLPITVSIRGGYKPLERAVYNGNHEVVDIILPYVNNTYEVNSMFLYSCRIGSSLMVEKLLPFVDVKHKDNISIISAIYRNNKSVIELLIPYYKKEELIKLINVIDHNNYNYDFIERLKSGVSVVEEHLNKIQNEKILSELFLDNKRLTKKRKI